MLIFSPFINNAALLLVLSVLSANFQFRWLKIEPLKSIILGVLYGLFAVVAMSTPMVLEPGVFFDGRSVILSLAGFLTGNFATVIACVIAGIYRYILGGPGVFTGIGSVVIAAVLGVLFRFIADAKRIRINLLTFLLFGFIVHVILVGWFFTLPKDTALLIIRNVAMPYLVIFPIATMLMGGFMDGQQQRVIAEKKLKASEQKYRDLVNTLNEGIGIMNADGIITFTNPKLAKMLGYKVEEIIGQSIFKFMSRNKFKYMRHLMELRKQGKSDQHEYEFLIKNKKTIYTIVNATPVYDENGNFTGSVASVMDITDRKLMEKELAEQAHHLEKMVQERTKDLESANEQLIKAEKMATLGELAGSVGHELRNPLAVIANSIYLLKSSQSDKIPQNKEYINIIEKEVRNASQIITDLLSFSRIQPAEKEAIQLPIIFSDIWERISIPKNIQVECSFGEKTPPIRANPQQLDQIFINLISNACDAMPDGGTITIRAKPKRDMLQITIKDTGVGISEENIKKIFEPLFSTKARGVGLGLPIVLRLTELNEGKIKIQSKVGEGSTFTLEFPQVKS
jgi:PAS domain S-box-containing protein